MRIELAQQVAAPPERAFAVFSDVRTSPGRVSGILRVEMLTPGPVGVGTRWKETRRLFGKEAVEELWISAFEPARRIVVESDSCGARMVSTFRFEPAEDGTRVAFEMRSHARTLGARLCAPLGLLFKGMARRMLAKDLADLARAAEQAAR